MDKGGERRGLGYFVAASHDASCSSKKRKDGYLVSGLAGSTGDDRADADSRRSGMRLEIFPEGGKAKSSRRVGEQAREFTVG